MSGRLLLSGDNLQQASEAMRRAHGSFVESSEISVGADYGSGLVSSAAHTFLHTLQQACGASGERAAVSARWATHTQDSFIALDGELARSVSNGSGA